MNVSGERPSRNLSHEVASDTLVSFLQQLSNNPSLDNSFCNWLSRVDASYIPDLKKLKNDIHSVDAQTARVILLNFADFNKRSSK